MAAAVAEGAGSGATLIPAAAFGPADLANYDAFAFGCPSMGAEQLEESEFEPMFAACEAELAGRRVGLFGSYGWGDGEWMRSWEERCAAAGAQLAQPGVICCEAPDEDALAACRALGAALA
ncbi:MAG TPA: flavodoxin [Candidatus Fournierella merdipullorum]|uniref:Flavodoxin n=2 Tax=Candidatus Allofournierella merdipullorum TaxID=2838595 RepID=A0A9D2E3H2_9FIRM|nr:flavodoxin [Candidatus Fournierella merdipullorum]